VVAFDSGVLSGAVYPPDLAVGAEAIRFGEPILDAVFAAYLVEAMDTVSRGSATTVLLQKGKLDASFYSPPGAVAQNRILGEDHIEPLRNGSQQGFKERHCGGSVGLSMRWDKCKLRGSVDSY
jgi:hypothetical protein